LDSHDRRLSRLGVGQGRVPEEEEATMRKGAAMRCQHVDDDLQCRMDATRRVIVGCGDSPDPDQSGFAGTIYLVQVCKQHDPDPRRSMPLPRPRRSERCVRLRQTLPNRITSGRASAEDPIALWTEPRLRGRLNSRPGGQHLDGSQSRASASA
jgi:hypothetical protein